MPGHPAVVDRSAKAEAQAKDLLIAELRRPWWQRWLD
jgi:hypothetical protein